jgi:hypothetical protein
MKKTLLGVALALLVLGRSEAGTINTVITINNPATNISLNSSFAGLSYSKQIIPTGLFQAHNTAFVTICKRLGPTLVRMSADDTGSIRWDPTGKGGTPGQLSRTDINDLAGFLEATDWKILYGINLGRNTVASAVDEAAYVSQALGDHLYGFEIGNEPENFAANGIRPAGYDFADYQADWEPYAKAIRARLPNALLTGPASANMKFINPFSSTDASLASLLTLHYYRGRGIYPTSTLAELLAPNPDLTARLATTRNLALSGLMSRGYRVAECNSFSDSGVPGASNAFGSALWAIDFLFQLAQAQTTGANFHGGGDLASGYTPIADDNLGSVVSVRPVFYGIQLFSMMANGVLMDTEVSVPSSTFSAYAVANPTSSSVVLNNKDTVDTVSATLIFGRNVRMVSTYLLTAPSLESTSQVTFGGAPINSDGSWTPESNTVYSVLDHDVTVNVPPGSAMLIQTE